MGVAQRKQDKMLEVFEDTYTMRPERSGAGIALRSLRSLRAMPAENQKRMPGNRTVYLFLNRTNLFVYSVVLFDAKY